MGLGKTVGGAYLGKRDYFQYYFETQDREMPQIGLNWPAVLSVINAKHQVRPHQTAFYLKHTDPALAQI